MTNYTEILQTLPSLLENNCYDITVLANTSALLKEKMEIINWIGFYIANDEKLLLGPFQGKVACTVIPFSKGVCGKCARERTTIYVEDVHSFPGHIACDCNSESELCIPIIVHKEIYAVLDIDAPIKNRFSKNEIEQIKKIASIVEKQLENIIRN